MDHDIERRRDLRADGRRGQLATHQDHRLQPADHILRTVCVTGRQRAVVAGIHRLQHVQSRSVTHLADDDPVRSHPQRRPDQIPDTDLQVSFQIRVPRFQTDDVLCVRNPQFRRILDRDDPFLLRHEFRKRIQKRRLSRVGPAADKNVVAGPHKPRQLLRRFLRDRPQFHQPRHGPDFLPEAPDRQDRSVERHRGQCHVHPRSVREPGVDQRRRLIHGPVHRDTICRMTEYSFSSPENARSHLRIRPSFS